ncbi:MAG: 1-acyl-sn-glycerol-3-phosphate acyltransferase [Helicobacteraceae bacterium]|jgi:1-acyl-sn-glycerol-3-phosphate acyltransferase|nr:1-acyl-sn-glycerol-3-phosphate acyltransferase [Helicobacteraceae bacterium]
MRFRSFLFTVGYVLIVFFITFAGSVAGRFIPYKARFFVPKGVFAGAAFWLRVTCGVKYRIEGAENIPQNRAFVAVSNHQSSWETFALHTFIAPACTVLKRELLWIPFFGWSVAFLYPIAIDRSNAINAYKKVLKTGAERLKNGINIIIFPEGTRVKIGEVKEFKKSAAVLAKQAGVAIVPIAHNSGVCWPAREFLKHSGTIVMRIGKPIETEGKTPDQIHNEYTEWIRKEMDIIARLDDQTANK